MQCQELEARELEVERRTRALNLNAVRDAESKSAAPSIRSSRTRISQKQAHIKPRCASYSCGLSTATIEYSSLSVCLCVSVCLSVYTITQKNNGLVHLKLEHIVVN